ncbi:AAA family ATPase [Timonella senegalensis]|uniref:AAA family ATPase n=1 Tax=Timonella senegalensis TaxID=1465825 RepID=UPI00031A80BC|nr:AAA family ATPase [Timonella senegalensis]
MLKTLAIENYRSLEDVTVGFEQLNVITGPNGSGKSNLYRALGLINEVVHHGALTSLAHEGGLRNALYAGPRRSKRVALRLGIATDDFNYAIDLGLPQMGPFPLDPEVKSETVWHGTVPRPATILAQRSGQNVTLVSESGSKEASPWKPRPEESMLAALTDPMISPELYSLKETARGWRFYDGLRVDLNSPARRPSPATFTPTLAPDGSNLASALATVLRVGQERSLRAAVAGAFDGADISVEEDERGIATLAFQSSGLKRALNASEISDGTLRFIMLATILHSPRPAPLLVLNEPESSLHASLVPALARMIVTASRDSQIIVVSHSESLVQTLREEQSATNVIELAPGSPTSIVGQMRFEGPEWAWPAARS